MRFTHNPTQAPRSARPLAARCSRADIPATQPSAPIASYSPEGQELLPQGTFTIAQLFKKAGYTTAAFGKWRLGFVESTGAPDKMGFDLFFGYNCQREAHNYYPDHLWRNREKMELDGKTYSHSDESAPDHQ